jgi:hypothetical protein
VPDKIPMMKAVGVSGKLPGDFLKALIGQDLLLIPVVRELFCAPDEDSQILTDREHELIFIAIEASAKTIEIAAHEEDVLIVPPGLEKNVPKAAGFGVELQVSRM